MGFAITWFAFRTEEAASLFADLGLTPTDEKDDGPDAPIATATLKNRWQILWCNEYGCRFFAEAELRRLSKQREIVRCLVEEHVMASSAELWSNGSRVWWLSHEGENGPKGLEVDGRPPASFSEIRAKLEATQAAEGGDDADVDYIFEIPLLVAKSLVGFKHDEVCGLMTSPSFDVLSRIEPQRGFFARMLGRK